ncbi:MAG TPA: hypothetical protein DCM49_05065 [Lachnospiraceae bacterium]|nr:hypothetical protein [Lachnospiraceae bacterium]
MNTGKSWRNPEKSSVFHRAVCRSHRKRENGWKCWKTVFVWLWANLFYAHRQKKWIRLLENTSPAR